MIQNIKKINLLMNHHKLKKIKYNTGKEKMKEGFMEFIDMCNLNPELLKDTIHIFKTQDGVDCDVEKLNKNMNKIKEYVMTVKNTLDDAVYGHDNAKKQIEKIIGQWINGQQDGYCFGFEGPPGVGKTSLAKKGLSNCLIDDNGEGRPFSFIAMGGDSNGSTLHGHNYTYVASTWGAIVQILIDKKCMNPIIFIDEVDKISRTEHGKEITGILTHLLDPTQNDCFQDKYFTGIDFDLSKALFILSYNDPDAIDKVLLDRVHRIKFNSLTLEDKLVICKKYILPEICLKMGLNDMIEFPEETIKYIIEEYTCEAGVRKLKEQMFDIVGEINIRVLKKEFENNEMPVKISIDDIKNVYFKDRHPLLLRMVSNESQIGYINGMYATTMGNGGVLPIHAKFFPSDKFLELKLTGLQQEVMRESMNVSLTVAWGMTLEVVQKKLRERYDKFGNKNGINIHTGDNAVSKDGPSGGCAITLVIYSLLNDIAIKPRIGVTGEIQMSGQVTAIGGLKHKILGSLKQGIKTFLYPKENKKDFDDFYEKHGKDEKMQNIEFFAIEHVNEALDIVLDKK
jgi:ATP-dependent Lon protease